MYIHEIGWANIENHHSECIGGTASAHAFWVLDEGSNPTMPIFSKVIIFPGDFNHDDRLKKTQTNKHTHSQTYKQTNTQTYTVGEGTINLSYSAEWQI